MACLQAVPLLILLVVISLQSIHGKIVRMNGEPFKAHLPDSELYSCPFIPEWKLMPHECYGHLFHFKNK